MIDTRVVPFDEGFHVVRTQDVEPIAEWCKAQHNEGSHGSGDMRYAGEIPDVIVERYMIEHGVTFHEIVCNPEHVRRMLNDPANAVFRIWPGRL